MSTEVVIPDTTAVPRLLLLLAARGGRQEALANALPGLATQIAQAVGHRLRTIGLVRRRPDPIAESIGENRGFDAGLDLRLESGGEVDALLGAIEGLADEIGADAHVDLSYALAGPLHVLIQDDNHIQVAVPHSSLEHR